jgi:prophage regulatory protein
MTLAPQSLITLRELVALLKCSRSTIYARMDVGGKYYDPQFPRSISIGPRTVRWIESDVRAWLLSKSQAG